MYFLSEDYKKPKSHLNFSNLLWKDDHIKGLSVAHFPAFCYLLVTEEGKTYIFLNHLISYPSGFLLLLLGSLHVWKFLLKSNERGNFCSKAKKRGGDSVIRIQVNHRLKFLITFSPKKETI